MYASATINTPSYTHVSLYVVWNILPRGHHPMQIIVVYCTSNYRLAIEIGQ